VLVVLARHAHSELNVQGRINGDPSEVVHITAEGREEARWLGLEIANVPFDLCMHTRFGRTRETAEVALRGRAVPVEVEQLFDDIDVGDLEGATVEDYRAWKQTHTRADRFPGGESLDEAAERYVRGFRALVARGLGSVLVVCHEIPIRYALNGAAGSADLDAPVHDVPNATPFLFDETAIERAAERIEQLSRPA
jgi:broad specificity phosphatase PhoE